MVGARIAALRKQAQLTQAALAEHLHISPAAIGMYEQGRREPPYDVLIGISEEFGVTLDYLIAGHTQSKQDLVGQCVMFLDPQGHTILFDVISREELAALMAARHPQKNQD